MTPRIYVAGPMTGLPNYNFEAFHAAADKLRAAGYHVENPADTASTPPDPETWEGWMKMAIAKLVTCDEIAMLPGWEDSRGACIEFYLAETLKMPVRYLDGGDA